MSEASERLRDLFDSARNLVLFWWQRRTRGFDDLEVGDLDHAIIKFALPRLKRYREITIGFPEEFHEDPFEETPRSEEERQLLDEEATRAWDGTLTKMIRALELRLEHGNLFGYVDEEADEFVEDPALRAEFEEGWELFCEYFFALWD